MVVSATLLFSGLSSAEWLSKTDAIMGTSIVVELWHENTAQGEDAINAVMAEMRRIDRRFSPYIANSELSIVNNTAYQKAVIVTPELFGLLQASIDVSELSGGAFDISYASVGQFYDYRKGRKPSNEQLDAVLPAVDYRHIQLDQSKRTVRFLHKALVIDLGGIAKGHAVDRGIAILRELGVEHALVSAGGDSRLLGDKRGKPWLTGVKHPRRAQTSNKLATMIPLSNAAISTSGDYERFFVEDGKRYHHILSPKTGDSARKLMSVSVIGHDATTTDSLSTAIFVMGLRKGLVLINQLSDIDAIIIDIDGQLHFSDGLLQAVR